MSTLKTKIDKLIINSPFEEPKQHWARDETEDKFYRASGRRPAGYTIKSQSRYADAGSIVPIELVNKIRPRVKKWRLNNYPGTTGITRRLLYFWKAKQKEPEAQGRDLDFFFCQLEAIESLIWLKEAPEDEKTGLHIDGDGGEFERLCCKMATGTGKTFVMAMCIAWQILNKAAYPKNKNFSKNICIITPNLTVTKTLASS